MGMPKAQGERLLGRTAKRLGGLLGAACSARAHDAKDSTRARCREPRQASAGVATEKLKSLDCEPRPPERRMFALLVFPAALLAPRLSSPRACGCRCFITAVEPSFDAWSLPALLPNVFTNGGESVVSVERVEVYSEKLGWVTQIRGIEVTPAGVELGLVMFALLVYSRVQRERRGWLPGTGWQARAEEEAKKKGKGR